MNYEYTETEEAVLKVLQDSDPLLQPHLDLTLPGGMRIVGSWTPGGSFATLHIILNRITTVTVVIPMRAAWALADGHCVDGWTLDYWLQWFERGQGSYRSRSLIIPLATNEELANLDDSNFYKRIAQIEKFLLRGKDEHHEPDPDEPTPFNPMGDAA